MRPNCFFWIPAVFVILHSVPVVVMKIVVATSEDKEAGMGWSCCGLFDPMAVLFLDPHTFSNRFIPFLVIGGLQWLLIGLAVAVIWHWLKKISS